MNDTEGHVDILVCMAGTGGTDFGTASYLRSRNPNLQVVLVQPHPDSRLTPEHPDAQIIDGVLPAYDVPESALSDYLRPDWSDACINVRTEEAYESYWQKYNFWHIYPDGHRWIRNHITGFFWQNGQPGNDSDSFTNEGGYWMDSKGEYQGAAFPPHIKGDKIWTKKN